MVLSSKFQDKQTLILKHVRVICLLSDFQVIEEEHVATITVSLVGNSSSNVATRLCVLHDH